MREEAAINRFLLQIQSDRRDGIEHGLDHYRDLFPDHAEAVAREYGRLDETRSEAEGFRPAIADHPERVGNYWLTEVLGEGGMGTVYLAKQDHPVQRRVALKVIKLGMDSRAVIARFEAERQALALMEHDNIARVFDPGTTDRGQPFFAMEFVPGLPIAKHCDTHRLNTRQRLELFIAVCAGVQHAHQKGVIHRDLKPSNILVSLNQGHATPKIIDFGVARATDQRLVEGSVFTEHGQLIGTPEYMSPEQADTESPGIDTRTDIYSLGVVLYELLVGERPFSSAELRRAGLQEIQRVIRQDVPSRPSTRISTSGASSDAQASMRQTTVHALRRELRGDLDWIVMKALEKDPDRRYGTANELAADVHRYLRQEPVLACPPSAVYRVRKFARRYRAQVIAAGLVFFMFSAGLVGTLFFAVESNRFARSAEQESARAVRVREYLEQIIASPRPGELGPKTLLIDVLVEHAGRLEQEFPNDLDLRGQLHWTMGLAFAGVGHFDLAIEQYTEAVEDFTELYGERDARVIRSVVGLGHALLDNDQFEQSAELLRGALAAARDLPAEDQDATVELLNSLGIVVARDLGLLDEGAPYFEEALERGLAHVGEQERSTLLALNSLARVRILQNRLEEAEDLARKSLELRRRVFGPDKQETWIACDSLAFILHRRAKCREADGFYGQALAGLERVSGLDHVNTLRCLDLWGDCLFERGMNDEALVRFEEAHRRAVLVAALPDDVRFKVAAGLANCLLEAGRPADAAQACREALPYFEEDSLHLSSRRKVVTTLARSLVASKLPGEAAAAIENEAALHEAADSEVPQALHDALDAVPVDR